MVRPKKFLGQHFLKNERRAGQIADALSERYPQVLEIGPGMGVLTKYLLKKPLNLKVAEIDRESVAYLNKHYPELDVLEGDFLKMDIDMLYEGDFSIIGNFPYNISSQIFFRVLEHRKKVKEVVCMIQKEVAERIASPPGNKTYGILSVLMQAYYDVEYLYTVKPGEFFPPPKVNSAVIRFSRNNVEELPCDERLFFQVVKQGFQMRRKTLRNALKTLNLPQDENLAPLLELRAEQLTVEDFITITHRISEHRSNHKI